MHSPHLLIFSTIINVSLSFLLGRVKELWVEDSTSQALPKSRRSLLENNCYSNTAPLLLRSRTADSLFHSFGAVSQLGRRRSSPCRTDLSVPEDRPAAPSCLSALVRAVRRRTERLPTPRLGASPAGGRCGPEPRGPSWPAAGRRLLPRLGWRASGWAAPPAAGAAAAPGA